MSRISAIVRSQRFGVQAAPKDRGLFFNGVFVDARKSVFRHGPDSRKDAPVISERIVVTPYRFHHRAQREALRIRMHI